LEHHHYSNCGQSNVKNIENDHLFVEKKGFLCLNKDAMDMAMDVEEEVSWWAWILQIFRRKTHTLLSSTSATENIDTNQLSPRSMEEE
jgi:hypothetical protein